MDINGQLYLILSLAGALALMRWLDFDWSTYCIIFAVMLAVTGVNIVYVTRNSINWQISSDQP